MFLFSNTNNPLHPNEAAGTVDELLACHGQEFVRIAYRTLLDREPDPEGMSYYLGQLCAGSLKMHILEQIYFSPEGKTKKVKLPGLDTAIRRYRRIMHPLFGWFFRLLNNAEGNDPTERRLRVIEQQLSLLGEANRLCLNRMEETLGDLTNQFGSRGQSIVLGTTHNPKGGQLIRDQQLSVKFRRMPLRARGIYCHLRAAVANEKGVE